MKKTIYRAEIDRQLERLKELRTRLDLEISRLTLDRDEDTHAILRMTEKELHEATHFSFEDALKIPVFKPKKK